MKKTVYYALHVGILYEIRNVNYYFIEIKIE